MNDSIKLNETVNIQQNKPIICINNVSVAYGRLLALYKIHLDVHEGEFIGLIGPNGSGKTSLLKTILGVLKPLEGAITLFGRNTTKTIPKTIKFQIGYVPQFTSFDKNFPALVKDVVEMGLYGKIGLFKRLKKEDLDRVDYALSLVDMENMANRPIGHLSGGQQQKVMIAQALVLKPKVLLLDEPTASLDFKMAKEVMKLLHFLNSKEDITVITINHNIKLLREYAKRIVCINRTIYYDGEVNSEQLDQVLDKVFYGSLA